MNAIPLINNIPKTNINNEKQLRQEINTSLVALKKEAGTLEGLINEAAQMLVTINNRIATLENDTVKKSDIVDVIQSGNLQPVTSNAVADKISSLDVSSVGGSGKYISAISETDGKINATASNLATSVASGNTNPVTSGAVASAMSNQFVDVASENVSLTLSANEGTSGNFTFTVPSGYKVVGFNGYITSGPGGAINLYSIGFNNLFGKTGTFTSRIFFRNYTSAQQTASIQVYLLCARV